MQVIGEGKVFCRNSSVFAFYAGPEYYGGLGTLALIIAISALFNVFTAPYFINTGVLGALIVVWIAQAVSVVAILSLLFRDPGIVPRSLHFHREQYDPVKGIFRERAPPAAFENAIRTFPQRSKFCDSCGTVRAPRVVHCSSDDVDMERFDHHCPWLGCCVAKRNYKIFLCFLVSLSTAVLGVIGVSIAHLALYTLDDYNTSNDLNRSVRTSLAGNIPVAIVCGISVIFMWFIVGLTAYHIFLATHAMTTYEHIRGAFESIGNPYDRGAWYKNLLHAFAEPIRPSWVNLKTKTFERPIDLDSEVEVESERRIGSLREAAFSSAMTSKISPIVSEDSEST